MILLLTLPRRLLTPPLTLLTLLTRRQTRLRRLTRLWGDVSVLATRLGVAEVLFEVGKLERGFGCSFVQSVHAHGNLFDAQIDVATTPTLGSGRESSDLIVGQLVRVPHLVNRLLPDLDTRVRIGKVELNLLSKPRHDARVDDARIVCCANDQAPTTATASSLPRLLDVRDSCGVVDVLEAAVTLVNEQNARAHRLTDGPQRSYPLALLVRGATREEWSIDNEEFEPLLTCEGLGEERFAATRWAIEQ